MRAKRLIPCIFIGSAFGIMMIVGFLPEFGFPRSLLLGVIGGMWVGLFCSAIPSLRPKTKPISKEALFRFFLRTGIPFGVYAFTLFSMQFGIPSGFVFGIAGSLIFFGFAFMIAFAVRHVTLNPNQEQVMGDKQNIAS